MQTTETTANQLPARLLGFLALEAAVAVAVTVAAGKLHSGHAVGIAAAVVGILVMAAFSASVNASVPEAVDRDLAAAKRRDRTKTLLALTAVVGAASYFGGNGTYSSFNAETTNAGSTAASGTLTLSDTTSTQCLSMTSPTVNNVNAACPAILNLTNLGPGSYGGSGTVTLKNTGSLDASKLYFWASQVNSALRTALTSGNAVTTLAIAPLEGTVTAGDSIVVTYGFNTETFTATGGPYTGVATATLNAALTSGNNVSSLTVTGLNGTVYSGDSITVNSGSNSQTFTATGGPYAPGATTITVSTVAANFSYPVSSSVGDTSAGPNIAVTSLAANYSYPAQSTLTDSSSNVGVSTTLGTGLTNGANVTTLSVAALPKAIYSGDFVTVSSGGNTETFVASAQASSGATSISVQLKAANFSYPIGSQVFDANNIDCYDQKTTPPGGSNGPTKGVDLNFNSTAANPLCAQLQIFVQETTGGPTGNQHYCWWGNAVGTTNANAMCAMPISVNLTSTVDSSTSPSTLPLAALNGNIRAGDTLKVTDGSFVMTCTVASGGANDRYYGYTGSVNVGSCTSSPSAHVYATSSLVTDTTMQSTLNADSVHTLTNFDTSHSYSGQIQLYPTTADGTVNNAALVELAKAGTTGDTRVFQVGIYLPAPGGINQNAIQGLFSTFGLTWHIDQ